MIQKVSSCCCPGSLQSAFSPDLSSGLVTRGPPLAPPLSMCGPSAPDFALLQWWMAPLSRAEKISSWSNLLEVTTGTDSTKSPWNGGFGLTWLQAWAPQKRDSLGWGGGVAGIATHWHKSLSDPSDLCELSRQRNVILECGERKHKQGPQAQIGEPRHLLAVWAQIKHLTSFEL